MLSLLQNTYFIIFLVVMFILVGLPLVVLIIFLKKMQHQFERYEQTLNEIISNVNKVE